MKPLKNPLKGRQVRLQLRGAAAAILGIALSLALLRPQLQEASRWVERRTWYSVSQGDLDRHLKKGRAVAGAFLSAVRTGRLDAARRLMTTGCRRRLAETRFGAFVKTHPALSETCVLTVGFIKAPQGWPVSEYDFQGRADQERTAIIKIVMISEYSEIRVDRVEVGYPD